MAVQGKMGREFLKLRNNLIDSEVCFTPKEESIIQVYISVGTLFPYTLAFCLTLLLKA